MKQEWVEFYSFSATVLPNITRRKRMPVDFPSHLRVSRGHLRILLELSKPYKEGQDLVILSPKFGIFLLRTESLFPPPPQKNSYVGILSLSVMGGGCFRRWFVHEVGALVNRISTLLRRDTRGMIVLFATWGHNKETAICESWEGPSPRTQPPSRAVRNKYLFFKPSVSGSLLWQPKLTNTPRFVPPPLCCLTLENLNSEILIIPPNLS